ncbi:hypothetical protein PILCRDRAFT_595071 [Piloderma croceum F 1598]|uniref:Uncharacterized protein n=1 Tax=Piloderma croceum (strain F 1598) TaxID=765440 RepID=A0A0C3BLU7_PILCF|nr:hypothetical protein PILCRDRAFT_595071 [Piloderma croceum F 1598]
MKSSPPLMRFVTGLQHDLTQMSAIRYVVVILHNIIARSGAFSKNWLTSYFLQISKVSSTLAQLCRDKIGKTWDLWTDLQKSRGNEEDLEEQLREAQAVARALQDELHQALYMYRAANPHSPYEMTVIRTDPDYVDALGRTCWR